MQNYCSAKFCQNCILCLLTVLPYSCNYFDFFITMHIFKRACMDFFMPLAIVAPSISTQMFIQKCLSSVMCTSFHSLFLIYELKLIAKGSLSSLAVLALCLFMQSKNLLCIFKSVRLLGTQDDSPLIAVLLCSLTTLCLLEAMKILLRAAQHAQTCPNPSIPCFQTFPGTNNMSKRVNQLGCSVLCVSGA